MEVGSASFYPSSGIGMRNEMQDTGLHMTRQTRVLALRYPAQIHVNGSQIGMPASEGKRDGVSDKRNSSPRGVGKE